MNAVEYVPLVRGVLQADWIQVYRSSDIDYVTAFAHYHQRLVVDDDKNLGECGVLAMGEVYKCEVVIDDATPRRIAEEKGIRVSATVPLLCQAIRDKKITMVMAEGLADTLLRSEYFLPFERGGFRQHALENDLLDYDEA